VFELPVATGATGAQGSEINWYAVSGVADASTGVAVGLTSLIRGAMKANREFDDARKEGRR
jgi:hypothetical protein